MTPKTLRLTKAGFLAIFIVLCLATLPAFAQGNIRIGNKIKANLGIAYKAETNDNIYFQNKDFIEPTKDIISTFTPSVILNYAGSTPDNFLELGYMGDIAFYTDNTENNYQRHMPYFAAKYKAPTGFYFRFRDDYLNTDDPYGSQNEFLLGTPQAHRQSNKAEIGLGYEFGERFAVEPYYWNYFQSYERAQDKYQNRTDNVGGLYFFYNYSPKTKLLAEYRFTDAQYNQQDDGTAFFGTTGTFNETISDNYTENAGFIGARFAPGGKLEGDIKIGAGNRAWKNDFNLQGNARKDVSTWLAETDVFFQAAARTRFEFILQRSQIAAFDLDAPSYINTLVGIGLEQGLINRLNLGVKLGWQDQDYQDEYPTAPGEKEFTNLRSSLFLDYLLKEWLTASVGYDYWDKGASDNYKTSEFQQNIFWVKLAAQF
jgi:hypothetical protein